MKYNLLALLFLLFVTGGTYAQDAKYDMSTPIEFKETGWNKVLCMKNGNTVLFHFEPEKPIDVKVFDTLHKIIASREHVCKVLDINMLKQSFFKGLFCVDDEAVLFIEQEHLSRFGLVRLRFNSKTGELIEEKIVKESPGLAKRTEFFVMKNKEEDNYAILYSTDVPQFYTCDVQVVYFNDKHEVVKTIPLNVERKNYDFMYAACAESKPNGICVVLDLKKSVMNRTVSAESPQREVYDHHEAIYYIPRGADKPYEKIVDMSTDITPYYADLTYNAFANAANLLLFSYRSMFYKFGIDVRRGLALADIFYKFDVENNDIKLNWVNNNSATALLQKSTDTTKSFNGFPIAMFTDRNGLTTLVSEGYERYDEQETGTGGRGSRYDWNTFLGNIAITQLDDDGNEIWGTLLPHSEYLRSYIHYYHPREVAKKAQSHKMFDDRPPQITERQFVSLNAYNYNNNLYIICNDDNANYQNIKEFQRDTVFNLEQTNACYYKMTNKKEITKNYLLGEPGKDEYKCSFVEGADFDEQRGTYATLVQYTRDGGSTLRMAWAKLN